jgi:hypothetical protein
MEAAGTVNKNYQKVLPSFTQPPYLTISDSCSAFEDSPQSSLDTYVGLNQYNRILAALYRVSNHPAFSQDGSSAAPYGVFYQRPVIGECSVINGGIYLSAYPREAVVVDERYELLNKVYARLTMTLASVEKKLSEHQIVTGTLNFVLQVLPFSEERVRNISLANKIRVDQRTALDFFLINKCGVARHQVLLAGYLLEKLKARKILKGCVYIDPFFKTETAEDERLIYTCSKGSLFKFSPLEIRQKTDSFLALKKT